MVKSVGRLLTVALIGGSVLSFAQSAAPVTSPQPGAELVVEWADPVLQWNAVTLATTAAAGKDVIAQQRLLDIVHLAIFEATNAISEEYEPYLRTLGTLPGASPDAAAIGAAHSVLIELVPEQAPCSMRRAPVHSRACRTAAKDAGLALGAAAARAMIDHRVNDGFEPPEFFLPTSTGPGEWQLTPGCRAEGGILLHLRTAKPFGIVRGNQFRADPPPPLTSGPYARALNEMKAVGGRDSTQRSPDRADVARFYAAVLNVSAWNPVAQQIALAQKRTLIENARAFALLNMAMTDALIAVIDSKYHYRFWRPETAIAAADTDGNSKTDPDPAFVPFITTPCHPSYPAGHGVTAGAARGVIERIYGHGPHTTQLWNPAVPDVRLEYSTVREIADDIDDARIYGGIHFRFDQQAAQQQGRRVASYILRHHLRPKRSSGARRMDV